MNPDSNVQTETSNSTVVIPKSTVTKPENPSQYIRTYAKDVAKFSGQPAPAPTVDLGKQPLSFSLPAKPDVLFTEQDSSVIEGEKAGDKRDSPVEVLETTKEDERGIFEEVKKTPPAPYVPDVPLNIVTPATPELTEISSIVTQSTTETTGSETRDGILARLRAKINAAQTPAPLEKRAGEMNLLQSQADLGKELPTIAPRKDVASSSEPFQFPIITPQPSVSPTPEFIPLVSENKPVASSASPLHTYSTDFAARIDERKATTFSVIAAEQDAIPLSKTVVIKSEIPTSSKLRFVFAILLLIGGIGVITVGYQFFAKSSMLPVAAPSIPSIIAYDSTIEITNTEVGLMEALALKTKEDQPQGNIRIPYIAVSSSTALGTIQTPQPGSVLIAKLSTKAPEILLRNTGERNTVGIIHSGDENRVFFIFDVASYERTFAGMLTWEPSIINDLAPLYPEYPTVSITPEPLPVVSSPGKKNTTNVPVVVAQTTTPTPIGFIDAVVANHDVREYKDSSNRTILIYGYKDKSTLIIARNEAAFSSIVAKLSAGSAK